MDNLLCYNNFSDLYRHTDCFYQSFGYNTIRCLLYPVNYKECWIKIFCASLSKRNIVFISFRHCIFFFYFFSLLFPLMYSCITQSRNWFLNFQEIKIQDSKPVLECFSSPSLPMIFKIFLYLSYLSFLCHPFSPTFFISLAFLNSRYSVVCIWEKKQFSELTDTILSNCQVVKLLQSSVYAERYACLLKYPWQTWQTQDVIPHK